MDSNFILASIFIAVASITAVSCFYYGKIVSAVAFLSMVVAVAFGVNFSYLFLGIFVVFGLFFINKVILTESMKMSQSLLIDSSLLLDPKSLSLIKNEFIIGPFEVFILDDKSYSEEDILKINEALSELSKAGIDIKKYSGSTNAKKIADHLNKSNSKIMTSDDSIIKRFKGKKSRVINVQKAIEEFQNTLTK